MSIPVAVIAVVMKQPTVSFPNADVDEASNDSFGRMLCRIHRRVYAMCSCRSDDGDYVAIDRVWRQILFRSWHRNVFWVSVVAPTRQRFVVHCGVERLDDAVDDDAAVVDDAAERPGHSK